MEFVGEVADVVCEQGALVGQTLRLSCRLARDEGEVLEMMRWRLCGCKEVSVCFSGHVCVPAACRAETAAGCARDDK